MTIRKGLWLLAAAGILFAVEQQHVHTWHEFPAFEYNDFPIPPDYQEKTEWAFARLMYPNMDGVHGRGGFGGRRRFAADWREGGRGVFWTMDYPRSDRHFSLALRRLTRIHVRSVEQPINLDDGDQFDWPWMYAVEVGHWNLSDAQVKSFREYFDRGGFFMCDDFHGTEEWDVFSHSMQKVFPDRQIVDIPKDDPIFHTVYDLDDKYQVPGEQFVRSGRTYEYDGYDPHWRGIYDEKGRLVVAICHDMDLGDSWEHADNPEYPQKFSAMGIRIGVNYVVYGMTH
ncbi:MAG TPA: DUF4159 domain-containing protein [Candidatus Sulfopaludibacter sp.]|jgi:hypothetical protein|nr:DUF4159 domain-containing protein [Candidatus Sulfopaludibacter sp.]